MASTKHSTISQHETNKSEHLDRENVPPKAKKQKVVQKYRNAYHDKHPCLIPSQKGEMYVHCMVCKSDFGCRYGGLLDCTWYIQATYNHKFETGSGNQQMIKSFFECKKANVSDLDMHTMWAEVMLCDLTVEGNLPMLIDRCGHSRSWPLTPRSFRVSCLVNICQT